MWADRVLCVIQCLVKSLLLRQEHHSAMILRQASIFAWLFDCSLDITPDVRCIIPVEVDDGLWGRVALIGLVLSRHIEIARDLIEILLVSHGPDDINHLMERHCRVLLQVGVDLVSQDSIVWNFLKLDCWQGVSVFVKEGRVDFRNHPALRNLFLACWIRCWGHWSILLLGRLKIGGCSWCGLAFNWETFLDRKSNILGQGRLAHTWEAHWHEE